MANLECLDTHEFTATPRIVLMDLELTCWEDSLRTLWSDPLRPPEVIEIGLALYDQATRDIVSTFSALIRPKVNSQLSSYCQDLLRITQQDIDLAKPLPEVVEQIAAWERRQNIGGAPTCTWCT
jgi:inhibitor of KinA sporulation pathway (predicted exonuclease)